MAKKPSPAAGAAEMSLGDLIDALDMNRQNRRKYEEALKPLEEEYKVLKADILSKMLNKEISGGLEKAGGKFATVSISRTTVPVLDDPLVCMKYLVRTGNVHALLSQPFSTPAWRELVERKGADLPGTHTFEKVDLNHSSIK